MPDGERPVRFRDLPILLRLCFIGCLASFFLMILGFYVNRGHPARTFAVLLGTFAILNGIILASDIHGAAKLYGQWALRRGWRTLGVNHSRSIFANTWFIRVFGVFLGVVGVGFAFAILSGGS